MGPRIACIAMAIVAAAPALSIAQTNATPLPPQNYGSQPGFFRSAPEMQALTGATAGVPTATPPAPAPARVAAAPAVPVAVATPTATVVAVTPERVPDPTQNLQWTERQADRAEATAAAAQREQALAPKPIAPGAYNGQTDPATR